jgi:hypothetical protein
MFHTIVASKREMTSRKRLENQSLLLLALLLLLAAHSCASVTIDDRRRRRKNGHPLAREIRVANKAGAKFDFYWIHPETRVLAGSNTDGEGVPYGGESAVSSFVGHAFEVQELEPCKRQLCRKGYFKVNGNEDQIYTVDKDFLVTGEDHKTIARKKAADALSGCAIDHSPTSSLSSMEQLDALMACIEGKIEATVQAQQEEITFNAQIRQSMGSMMVDYVCNDTSKLETSRARFNETLTFEGTEKYDLQVLFQGRKDSKDIGSRILLANDWYTPSEAEMLLSATRQKMGASDALENDEVTVKKLLSKLELLVSHAVVYQPRYRDVNLTVQTHSNQVASAGTGETTYSTCAASESPNGICAAATTTVTSRSLAVSVTASSPTTTNATGGRPVATLFVFVQDDVGALHFPQTGVRVRPQAGQVLLAMYDDVRPNEGDSQNDPTTTFVNEYVMCAPPTNDTFTVLIDEIHLQEA